MLDFLSYMIYSNKNYFHLSNSSPKANLFKFHDFSTLIYSWTFDYLSKIIFYLSNSLFGDASWSSTWSSENFIFLCLCNLFYFSEYESYLSNTWFTTTIASFGHPLDHHALQTQLPTFVNHQNVRWSKCEPTFVQQSLHFWWW